MFVQHFCCSEDGDVDITGFDATGASFCINDTIYEVKSDSVIMQEDADKYGGTTDESDNESSCSSDSDETMWRYLFCYFIWQQLHRFGHLSFTVNIMGK